tara:strand:- start:305 stop:853 length:549 start_codon:yes stop_codon:yes gene_type:complete
MISRSEAIKIIMDKITPNHLVISTTGMISRELFNIKDRKENFYMIGSMGLAASFAMGISISNPEKKIIVLDGDGSFLMNLGSSSSIGFYNPKNFFHIVLDNFSYQSTGNQPSVSEKIDLCNIANSSGYKNVQEFKEFNSTNIDLNIDELSFYRIHVSKESSEDISRVNHTPDDIMINFQSTL